MGSQNDRHEQGMSNVVHFVLRKQLGNVNTLKINLLTVHQNSELYYNNNTFI